MTTIPASAIVDVNPGVLSAGGAALDLNGLILSTSARVPIGTVSSFPDAAAVSNFFGGSSDEATIAGIYFNGYDNSTAKPGAILFAQYNIAAVPAYLRGNDVSALTLAELQALNGVLGILIDGVLKQATINLAAATSFSNAAGRIADSLGIQGAQVATVTGSIGGTTLTVTAIASGVLAVGDVLSGTGVVATTYITAQLTGVTGSVGTYSVSDSQTAASQAITAFAAAVQYDSVSGGFIVYSSTTGPTSSMAFGSGALATSLKLTSITGAVLSQGAAIATPEAFMDDLVDVIQNWATFMLTFDPDAGSGNAQKLLFATWTNAQDDRYAFICWDTDASPTTTVPATSSLGYLLAQASFSGTCLIGEQAADIGSPLVSLAAFECGAIASIDFEATNGRATLAFRSQTGLTASVTDRTVATNLIANGYNFYGAYATGNDQFVFFYPGSVSGPFLWQDSYVNQIWLNNAFQLALMVLLTQALSVPYNPAGRAQIESALADPINAGLNFGAFRAGVVLSAAQIAAVNAAAGANIAPTLQTRGWYLKVGDASPAVRQTRGSPPCTFFYMDGQSVQQIDLASIALQ